MPPWALALAVTLVIEVPLVTLLYPHQRGRMALVALVANVTTNLFLNRVLLGSLHLGAYGLFAGELIALVGEAAVYALVAKPRDLPRAFFASGLANALSYLAGWFLWPLILR